MTDPRSIPGSISGPGGPHDQGAVLIDTRHAVLLDSVMVSTLDEQGTGGQFAAALELAGRLNRSQDRARVVFLLNSDAIAAIITELIALIGRASKTDARAVLDDLIARTERLAADGNLS